MVSLEMDVGLRGWVCTPGVPVMYIVMRGMLDFKLTFFFFVFITVSKESGCSLLRLVPMTVVDAI